MDANRFDRWTKAWATRVSRRVALKGISGAFLAQQVAPHLGSGQKIARADALAAIHNASLKMATTASQAIDTSYTPNPDPGLMNPERGIYYWAGFNGPVPEPVPHTVVARWLYLGGSVCREPLTWNGHTKPGTSPVLDQYAAKLVTHRAAGEKVLFRPRYDTPGDSKPSSNVCGKFQADTLDLQLGHIEAVAAMLGEFKDVVAFIEAGYLGRWGEWNTAGFPGTAPLLDSTSDRATVLDQILRKYDEAGVLQQVGLRRPVFAAEAIDLKADARVGIYNDCFMANKHDYGTYLDFPSGSSQNVGGNEDAQLAYWKPWAKSLTATASFGGETCPDPPNGSERWALCDNMTGTGSEPASLHMSYLHGGYSPAAIETWEQGDSEGKKCYDEIRRRLGYRFEVNEVEYSPTVAAGQMFQVRVDIKNTGWARLHKPRQAILVLRNESIPDDFHEFIFSPSKVEDWAPGQTTTITVSAPPPGTGTYRVRLWIPDPDVEDPDNPGKVDRDAPQQIPYAVRLASLHNDTEVFDPDTGENDLGVLISMQADGCSGGLADGATCAAHEECCSGICQAQLCVPTLAGTCEPGDDYRTDESAKCGNGDCMCYPTTSGATICAWAGKCGTCTNDADCAEWSSDSFCARDVPNCSPWGGSLCVLPCTPFVNVPE